MPDSDALGVIFDMDGVLVDSFSAHRESWRLLARELGRDFTDEQFHQTFGQRSADIIRALFGPRDDAETARLDARKESLYRDLIRGRVPVMPGATELIDRLHAGGFRLAVGSSGPPENVALVVDGMGLRSQFAAVVTGADVQRGKPDPQVFTLAAQRLRLPPQRCAVIEDAPVGIEAARRAGCYAVGLAGSHAMDALLAADMILMHLNELTGEILRRRLRG